MYVLAPPRETPSHTFPSLSGDFFIPTFRCPHRLERIGVIGDGGKWVCGLQRVANQKKCVIYSFGLSFFPSILPPSVVTPTRFMIGVNGESSFEATLLKRAPNCEVWGYDFSVGGVSASCPFLFSVYRRPFAHFVLFGSGDLRSVKTQSSGTELTSKPWR